MFAHYVYQYVELYAKLITELNSIFSIYFVLIHIHTRAWKLARSSPSSSTKIQCVDIYFYYFYMQILILCFFTIFFYFYFYFVLLFLSFPSLYLFLFVFFFFLFSFFYLLVYQFMQPANHQQWSYGYGAAYSVVQNWIDLWFNICTRVTDNETRKIFPFYCCSILCENCVDEQEPKKKLLLLPNSGKIP